MRPLLAWMALGLPACRGDAADTAASPWGACGPFTLEPVRTWDQDALLGPGAQPDVNGNVGVGLGDLDGDGWLDALIVTPEGSLLLQNDGAGDLVDGALEVEGGVPEANAVALGDLDGDGDLDAWLGRRSGLVDLVLRNQGGGRFVVEELPGTPGERASGALGDLDGDGDLDLFASGYAPILTPEGILSGADRGDPSALLFNEGGVLVPRDGALPEDVVDDVTFQGQLLDVEGDGDLDLYLANDFGPWLGPNRLLLNDGQGRFTLDVDCACDRAMFAMGVAVGDPDGDADLDLYLTDLAGPDLLLNDGAGAFYDATLALGADVPLDAHHLASWGVAFVDLDLDGWEDLPMVFGPLFPHGDPDGLAALGEDYAGWTDGPRQRDVVLRNVDGAGFVDVSEAAGFADEGMGRALAVGDLDRDGRPDLVTGGLWSARAWRNQGQGCAGLTLALDPRAAPRLLGQVVHVEGGGRSWTRSLSPSTTWSSSAHEWVIGGITEPIEIVVRDAAGRTLWQGLAGPGERVVLP